MVLSTFLENCSCLAQPYPLLSQEATFDKYLDIQYELQKWASPLHPGLTKNSHKQSLTCLFEITDYLQIFDLSFLMNQQWHICLSNDFCSVGNYLLQWCIYPFTSYVTAVNKDAFNTCITSASEISWNSVVVEFFLPTLYISASPGQLYVKVTVYSDKFLMSEIFDMKLTYYDNKEKDLKGRGKKERKKEKKR